jgi:hypothetical protein
MRLDNARASMMTMMRRRRREVGADTELATTPSYESSERWTRLNCWR